jgi:hypothetical protein
LHTEALLAQYCGLQFDMAKKIRMMPGALEDTFAARIVRVLQQLDTLLDLSQLPSLEILVAESIFNSVEEQPDVGMYAGLPAPTAIREMQMTREAITIYTYLLLAEVGLASILAHYTPHENFEVFRSVKREYAESFFAAVQKVNLSSHEAAGENGFQWVGGENDRATCRTVFGNIVKSLKVVEILRTVADRPEAG